MKTFSGELHEIGDGKFVSNRGGDHVKYSYIEIGDQIIRKVMVMSGLDTKLRNAVGSEATLFVSFNAVVGVQSSDGRTYSTSFPGNTLILYFAVAFMAVLGLFLLPFFGIGLFFFYLAYLFWKQARRVSDSKSIPNAIPL